MLRVSVSDMDGYRWWRGQEDAPLEQMRDRLLRREPPSEPMKVGIALHKALELACDDDVASLAANGYTFDCTGDLPALRLLDVRELKATKVYTVHGHEYRMVAMVDGIEGGRIEDHKSTLNPFDAEKYLDTWQWPIYLDVFDADTFRWNVFHLKDTDDPQTYIVRDIHFLEAQRYPEMIDHIESWLHEFGEFVREFVPEYITQQNLKEAL